MALLLVAEGADDVIPNDEVGNSHDSVVVVVPVAEVPAAVAIGVVLSWVHRLEAVVELVFDSVIIKIVCERRRSPQQKCDRRREYHQFHDRTSPTNRL